MRRFIFFLLIALLALPIIPIQAQDGQSGETLFSDIIFARDITLQTNEAIMPLTRFPTTQSVVVAIMDIEGLAKGATVTSQWLLNGEQQTASAYTHDSDTPNFRLWTNLANPSGIAPGTWRLRVLLNGEIAASGEFEVTEGPFVFPIRFGTSCGNFSGELFGHTEIYNSGATNIYAQVRYVNFPSNTQIQGVWQYEREDLEGAGLPIQTQLTGTGQRCFRIGDTRGLASGLYTLALRNGGNTLTSADVTIAAPIIEPEPDMNDSGE